MYSNPGFGKTATVKRDTLFCKRDRPLCRIFDTNYIEHSDDGYPIMKLEEYFRDVLDVLPLRARKIDIERLLQNAVENWRK